MPTAADEVIYFNGSYQEPRVVIEAQNLQGIFDVKSCHFEIGKENEESVIYDSWVNLQKII